MANIPDFIFTIELPEPDINDAVLYNLWRSLRFEYDKRYIWNNIKIFYGGSDLFTINENHIIDLFNVAKTQIPFPPNIQEFIGSGNKGSDLKTNPKFLRFLETSLKVYLEFNDPNILVNVPEDFKNKRPTGEKIPGLGLPKIGTPFRDNLKKGYSLIPYTGLYVNESKIRIYPYESKQLVQYWSKNNIKITQALDEKEFRLFTNDLRNWSITDSKLPNTMNVGLGEKVLKTHKTNQVLALKLSGLKILFKAQVLYTLESFAPEKTEGCASFLYPLSTFYDSATDEVPVYYILDNIDMSVLFSPNIGGLRQLVKQQINNKEFKYVYQIQPPKTLDKILDDMTLSDSFYWLENTDPNIDQNITNLVHQSIFDIAKQLQSDRQKSLQFNHLLKIIKNDNTLRTVIVNDDGDLYPTTENLKLVIEEVGFFQNNSTILANAENIGTLTTQLDDEEIKDIGISFVLLDNEQANDLIRTDRVLNIKPQRAYVGIKK